MEQGGLGPRVLLAPLRDWKVSVDVERMDPDQMTHYATLCGWTLAHAHARSGDPIAISAYLGKGDQFDKAMTVFAETYARQNRATTTKFVGQISNGRLEADMEH